MLHMDEVVCWFASDSVKNEMIVGAVHRWLRGSADSVGGARVGAGLVGYFLFSTQLSPLAFNQL